MKTKQISSWAAAFIMGMGLAACSSADSDRKVLPPAQPQKPIVILYENDVHCAIDGYAKLAGLRDAIAASDTAYVGVTSSGDFLNGSLAGTLARGQYIVDIMRNVGYDAITIGNHEFDFGGPRLIEVLPQIKCPVICANFFVEGAAKPLYPTCIVKKYGNKSIGFVGVCTPETMFDEKYSFFDNDGKQLYDLRTDDVAALVQKSVDSVRHAGADYVVLLSHLGEKVPVLGETSQDLISRIRGVDVVLDGHTHSVIPQNIVEDMDKRKVIVTQTGTQFANIGKLLITADGKISTSLIPTNDVAYSNLRVTQTTDSIKKMMDAMTNKLIGNSDFVLTINDDKGNRLIRNGETNLGDLCADAFRESCHADIGLINGGGIRNNIPAGRITLGHAINTMPFYNLMCKIEVTGEVIQKVLEKCTAKYPEEDGFFPHVAGMKYTILANEHTVTDVQVMNRETSQYEPLRNDRTYTIGITDYYRNGGFYDILKDAKIIEQTTEQTNIALANYIKDTLGGDVSAYRNPQGRITIK